MAEGLAGVVFAPRQAEPEHVHRRADVLDLKTGALAQRRMAAVAAHRKIGADLDLAVRRFRPHADNAAAFLDQIGRLRLHMQIEGRVDLAVRRQKIEEVPLRHQRDEFAARRQVAEVGKRNGGVADLSAQPGDARVRQLEEFVQQAELMHELQRRGMNGVAAKIAQEVGVLLQHHHRHAGARQQKAEHHAGRSPAGNAAGGFDSGFRHRRPFTHGNSPDVCRSRAARKAFKKRQRNDPVPRFNACGGMTCHAMFAIIGRLWWA